jgi:hypothetical protein
MFECRYCKKILSAEHKLDPATSMLLDNEIQKHSQTTGHASFRKVKEKKNGDTNSNTSRIT